MELLVAWTVLSLAIGALARVRGDGFLMAFVWSMALSPLVGFAVTMLRLPRSSKPEQSHST